MALGTAGLQGLLATALGSSGASPPPNVVFFLADDMGYGDAGYLATPGKHGRLLTPTLDKLVAEGMAFSEAYAGAPVCAPSRCTLVTGRHSGHCTVRSNGPSLGPGDVGFATPLRAHGWHTRHIGKWGLGDFDTAGSSPLDKGFEYYYGQLNQGFCHNYYPDHMNFGQLLPNGTQDTYDIPIPANRNASNATCGPDRLNCAWSGDLWTAEALKFFTQTGAAKDPPPFMLYLAYTAPHAGGIGTNQEGQPPVPRISTGPYEARREELGKEIGYASAVTEMDRQLSLVLAGLENASLTENTMVWFASDNGASNEGGHNYETFRSSGPLNGFKRSLHEGGHRSPLIVRWPGHIAAGVRSKQQFAFYDFFATMLQLAGLDPLPADQTDGQSLLPTLLGQPQPQKAFIYHEYCNPNERHSGWGQALRVGDWSGVCLGPQPSAGWPVCNGSSFLLYDLAKDLGQESNVAAANPAVVATMLGKMKSVRVNGHYCGESKPPPAPPQPPPPSPGPPIPLSALSGTWEQGHVAIAITVTANGTVHITPSSCFKWCSAAGSISADGHTIDIVASGNGSFSTSERGFVSGVLPSLTVAWRPTGGERRRWKDWTKLPTPPMK